MMLMQKVLRSVGTGTFTPRWLKVFCFYLCMRQVSAGLRRFTAGIDPELITPAQRAEVEALVKKFNEARGVNREKAE
ncbi:TPA: hypothetical protein ACJ2XE_002756 [Klebsiella quasipneumoniae]|uniref:hypothetical protein n=1 Tax=Klebsiella michiganensis TaxID=1134687 RepID=UPI001FD2B90A|nr:hypothetical protein [Klebsiella michiganensis]MDK6960198.1 hypothetical protein [Klebsiella michiganensis]MDS7889309.1 hypothetical protein [Klebsiella michiganensis]MEC5786288.1 hypothetical protein [Klebsiella michiganensis]UON97716.1 hypothetical protein MT472_07310 [Klebsiella michiganensis]HBM3232214.1 hypothetical protein [Klebsiella michiganensis]